MQRRIRRHKPKRVYEGIQNRVRLDSFFFPIVSSPFSNSKNTFKYLFLAIFSPCVGGQFLEERKKVRHGKQQKNWQVLNISPLPSSSLPIPSFLLSVQGPPLTPRLSECTWVFKYFSPSPCFYGVGCNSIGIDPRISKLLMMSGWYKCPKATLSVTRKKTPGFVCFSFSLQVLCFQPTRISTLSFSFSSHKRLPWTLLVRQ